MTVLNFGQIIVNTSKTVQDRDIRYFQWKTNGKSYVAYPMAPVLVTVNDLEGHSPVAGRFNAIRRTFMQ